jgi:RNA polymerase primary sigma factor
MGTPLHSAHAVPQGKADGLHSNGASSDASSISPHPEAPSVDGAILVPVPSRRTGTARVVSQRQASRVSADSIGWYLSTIGRVPLLTPAEEIELAHHVQAGKRLLELPAEEHSPQQKRLIRMGQRARDRMMAANLRLVVSVAKKYQNQGLELLDLVQEGAIGLERAVDKFDPAMGYKFSTYAYWWIRQGMTRAIDNSARTIRLPIHISEKLSKMRRITRELSHRLGRQPNRLEMSHAMGMAPEELEALMSQSAPCASLDAHARGEEDRSTLGELIADPASNEHFDSMDRHIQKEHLGTWLAQLNEREQKILKLRFGLEGSEPLTLAEIGRQINVSRERVRQLEAKAIMKLRLMSNLQQAA